MLVIGGNYDLREYFACLLDLKKQGYVLDTRKDNVIVLLSGHLLAVND